VQKCKGIVFTEKDRNITNDTNVLDMETAETEPHNINIKRTRMDDYNTDIKEMDATLQTGITQENKTATQAKSQEWTAITQATQRITM